LDDGSSEVNVGREAVAGLVGTQGDPLEFLEPAEEVLDQVAPLVHRPNR
jgi:hypothetical protein